MSSPLLRLVLVLLVIVGALGAGVFASSAFTGWLFLGLAFAAAPVAALVDGWARNRGRGTAGVARATSSAAVRVSPSVCTSGAATAW
jgi:hypothetical protein